MIRLFVFYVSRTLFHQVQRFIRTWAFFLVLVLLTLGGAAGYAARWYYHRLSSLQEMLPEDFMEFFEAGSLSNLNALELGAGLLILGILIIQVVGAEKSVSRLFMQADVNLLFASPISAQKVLALRLLVGLGPGLFTGLFLFFSVPRLMHRFSLTPYGAAAIPGTWLLTLVFCFFLKMLIYEVGSRHAFFRRNLRWFVFGFLGVALVFFYFSYKGSEEQVLLLSAHRFWNAPVTRYLPIWGWLKAYLLFALEGKQQVSLLFLLLCLVVILLMAISSLRIPADYYEETLRGAEEMALLREDYLREGAPLLVGMLSHRRGAERSGGFHYGKGSTVYLWKVLFLRFRSARFFLLTKTSLTYLFTALAAGCFVRFFMDEPLEYVPALTLAAMVFFRTIVSPVTEDIRKASFRLMPSSIWSKTFFSALGGSLGCALDAALPLMAGSL
ncbi:MAG: hypothetical protein IIY58_02525, partial [Aeriscardovia sp.]|nr:hypothetical protein [Aeriscardovia sp.]